MTTKEQMLIKENHLLTQNHKTKSDILNLKIVGIVLSILSIVGAVLIVNVKLYQDFILHQQMQKLLSQTDDQIHQLYKLTWEIIADRTISPTELNQIHNKRKLIRELLDNLEGEPHFKEHAKEIHELFNTYNITNNILFDLIARGDFKKAHVYENEILEPAYKKLHEAADNIVAFHDSQLLFKQKTFFSAGAAVTAAAFILVLILGRFLERNRKALLFKDLMYSQLKYIFDSSIDAICVIDKDFNIIRTNKTFVDKFGDYEDLKCYEICFSRLCHTDNCHLYRISNGEDFVEDLIERKLKDNSVGYYLEKACPYYDSNGQLVGIINNFMDVTEKTRSVEVLHRYKLLTKHARDIILFTSEDGRILDVNTAALKFYEYSKEQILALNIRDLYPPEVLVPVLDREELETEGFTFETVHKNGFGTRFPVEVSSIKVDFEDENIIMSIVRDITERKQAEQLLKEQKEFAENLILNSAVPTFVLDPQHKVINWNKACEELTGVKAEEVLGTENHWKAFYPKKRQCLADAIIDDTLERLPERYKIMNQSKIISKGLHAENWAQMNGQDKYVIIEAAPIFDGNNNLVAVIETVQDITKRKNDEEKLSRFNQKIKLELELASKAQRSLLPKELPDVPNICFAWKFEPSIYVGGDMLSVFYQGEDKIGFFILDVKGHGMSAALTAVTLNHHLRANCHNKGTSFSDATSLPSAILTQLNEYFLSEIDAFFTIICGTLDIKTLVMTYARAGHCLPIIVSVDGDLNVPEHGGVAVGLLKNATYSDNVIQLKPGDKVILYTDGVLEDGKSVMEKPFLMNDLANLVRTHRLKTITDIIDTVVLDSQKRTENLEVRDDITVLGFECK